LSDNRDHGEIVEAAKGCGKVLLTKPAAYRTELRDETAAATAAMILIQVHLPVG
jgi:hypothetical protein